MEIVRLGNAGSQRRFASMPRRTVAPTCPRTQRLRRVTGHTRTSLRIEIAERRECCFTPHRAKIPLDFSTVQDAAPMREILGGIGVENLEPSPGWPDQSSGVKVARMTSRHSCARTPKPQQEITRLKWNSAHKERCENSGGSAANGVSKGRGHGP